MVFTEPQIAAVGRTLQEALDAGIEARAVDADPGRTPAASFVGKDAPSAARIVVDERRQVIVGATFTGPDMAESSMPPRSPIVGEVPLRRLGHAHPGVPHPKRGVAKLLQDWAP